MCISRQTRFMTLPATLPFMTTLAARASSCPPRPALWRATPSLNLPYSNRLHSQCLVTAGLHRPARTCWPHVVEGQQIQHLVTGAVSRSETSPDAAILEPILAVDTFLTETAILAILGNLHFAQPGRVDCEEQLWSFNPCDRPKVVLEEWFPLGNQWSKSKEADRWRASNEPDAIF